MTLETSDFEAASAVKFFAVLMKAARNDSSGDPMKFLEAKLAKYEPIADEILGNTIWEGLDTWFQNHE